MRRISNSARRSLLAASAGIAMLAAVPAAAQPGCAPMSRLEVTGQGEARVAPDLAVIQIGVTSQAASAAEAMQQNATQQGAVIEALKAAGLADTEIQTSGLNLNPMMDYGENRSPRVTGYEATNMVSARVSDVARLGEVLDAVVAAGANQINGISFQREDDGATQDDARRAAIADARHKAEILAEAAGLTLGPVLTIRDAPSDQGPQPMRMMAADMAKGASTPVQPGQLSLSAQVEVRYALLGADGESCAPHGGMPGHAKPGAPKGQPTPPAGD